MPLRLVPGTAPFLPLVACRHRFATSSTFQHHPGRVPSAHSRQLTDGLTTVNRSLAPRRICFQLVHTSHPRLLTHHILRMAVPCPNLVRTFLGPRPLRKRIRCSFMVAYPSTAWITFGTSIRMVANKMHSGKVSTRVHSNTTRRYLSHCLISPRNTRTSDDNEDQLT